MKNNMPVGEFLLQSFMAYENQ